MVADYESSHIPAQVLLREGVHRSGSGTVTGHDSDEDLERLDEDADLDDDAQDTLTEKLSAVVCALAPSCRHIAVLCMRGSFCPIAQAHIMVCEEARNMLLDLPLQRPPVSDRPRELPRFSAVLGFLIPTSDRCLAFKLGRRIAAGANPHVHELMPISERRILMSSVTEEMSWLTLSSNASMNRFISSLERQYPERSFERIDLQGADVAVNDIRFQRAVDRTMSAGCNAQCPHLLIACRPAGSASSAVAVTRLLAEYDAVYPAEARLKYQCGRVVLLPEPPEFSASMVREALITGNQAVLQTMLHSRILQWFLERSLASSSARAEQLLEEERQDRRRAELACRAVQSAMVQRFERLELELTEHRRRTQCTVCMESERCIAAQPCFHLVTCSECFRQLVACPICRAPVQGQLLVRLA